MRDLTKEESNEIILELIGEEYNFLNFKNHRKHKISENTFRFTVDFISLDFLLKAMEHDKIKNVFFNPSAPPPGGSVDGISLRYKIYLSYYQVED
tara:strand:+ start:287 stop:571 length:285 start_codon:yes stop_codon:yes gene_type:complete